MALYAGPKKSGWKFPVFSMAACWLWCPGFAKLQTTDAGASAAAEASATDGTTPAEVVDILAPAEVVETETNYSNSTSKSCSDDAAFFWTCRGGAAQTAVDATNSFWSSNARSWSSWEWTTPWLWKHNLPETSSTAFSTTSWRSDSDREWEWEEGWGCGWQFKNRPMDPNTAAHCIVNSFLSAEAWRGRAEETGCRA